MLIPLSANPTKWSNTLQQSVVNLPTNCLNVFDHFVGLTLKGLKTVLELDITDTQLRLDNKFHILCLSRKKFERYQARRAILSLELVLLVRQSKALADYGFNQSLLASKRGKVVYMTEYIFYKYLDGELFICNPFRILRLRNRKFGLRMKWLFFLAFLPYWHLNLLVESAIEK